MSWQAVTPSDEVTAGDWIRERLHPFAAYNVGSVVPTGFAAYARIFHPAFTSRDWNPDEVRWSEVAAWSGRTVHPQMQFHSIAVPAWPEQVSGPVPWNGEPRLGVLSKPQARALIGLSQRYTSTPDDCWFCLWEGYGYLTGAASGQTAWKEFSPSQRPQRPPRWHLRRPRPRPIGNLPDQKRVRLPNRDYLLFRGPLSRAEGWEDGPNLWWPDDHAWCIASEIDLAYTYVGGRQELIDAIVGHPAIEALPAMLTDGITESSDTVNS
jgi:hypothetical protein